jgi:hypothetical protein
MVVCRKYTTRIRGETTQDHTNYQSNLVMCSQRCDSGDQTKSDNMLFAPFFHDDAPQGFSRSPKSSPDNQSDPNCLMSKITIPEGVQFLEVMTRNYHISGGRVWKLPS